MHYRRRNASLLLVLSAARHAAALLPILPLHRKPQRPRRRRHQQFERSVATNAATPLTEEFLIDEYCLIVDDTNIEETLDDLLTETQSFDLALRAAPIVTPLVAFVAYPYVAAGFRAVFALIKNANYIEVDGGQYEINILTPTLIGIVMPSLSISFGTLIATTVNTLRQRQLDLRVLLNQELSSVQLLRVGLDANFRGTTSQSALQADAQCTLLLEGYVSRVIQECTGNEEGRVSVPNNELGSLSALLSEHASNAAVTVQNNLHGLVGTLADRRSARLAHLATTYPAVHYAVLTAIAASIVLAYLVETDQEVLQFLSSLQLRLLFTILIGVFSGVGSVVTDIADPFRGAYRITSTVAQFFPLREALVADVACKRSALDAPPAE